MLSGALPTELGILSNQIQLGLDAAEEILAQADRSLFVPEKRFAQVGFGSRGDDQSTAHDWPVMCDLTSAQLEPSVGLA